MSLIDNGSQFIERERRDIVQHTVRPHLVTAIAVDLDPVRAIHDLLAHGFSRIVATCMRGPGITPRLIAFRRSTSAYPAPSVSTSRIDVNPYSSARRKFTVAKMVRYSEDCF